MVAAKYVFRLSRLLELRERQLQDCQQRLAEAILRTQATETRLRDLRREQMTLNQLWRDTARGAFHPDSALDFDRSLVALVRAEVKTMGDLIENFKAQRECQAKLERAMAKCKALEKLRGRGQARFTREFNK